MEARPVTTPAAAPIASGGMEACRPSNRVPTASNHQVRRPSRTSAPYNSATPTPATAPASASTAPSSRNRVRILDAEKPSERRTPISRVRCSIPSLKNRPVSSRAEAIRKKLK
jgi:hypothetical protein